MKRLSEILETMDLPAGRIEELTPANLSWLSRNMGANNKDHPDFKEAGKLLRKQIRTRKP